MTLLLRAVLVLGLASLLHATRSGQPLSGKLDRGTRQKRTAVRLVLDPWVNTQITGRSMSAIANMSLSPWTYNVSLVESRWPMWLSQAQCLTSGCLSLQGDGEDKTLEAAPIQYQILVLHRVQRQRRNKKQGKTRSDKIEFRLGTEVITVGCTCVRPSLVPR